jgi:hypothetical protein
MFEGTPGEDAAGKYVFVDYYDDMGTRFFGYLERRVR